jgi:hypothetical protein
LARWRLSSFTLVIVSDSGSVRHPWASDRRTNLGDRPPGPASRDKE